MNRDAIGAISEMIGAAAVVVTLLYLVKQIKQNTESNEAVDLQTCQSDSTAHWLAMAQNPELSRNVAACTYDSRDLSDDNWIQVGCWFLAWTKETGFVSADQIEDLSLDESSITT